MKMKDCILSYSIQYTTFISSPNWRKWERMDQFLNPITKIKYPNNGMITRHICEVKNKQ